MTGVQTCALPIFSEDMYDVSNEVEFVEVESVELEVNEDGEVINNE